MNNLGRSPLEDATYEKSKLYDFQFQNFFLFFFSFPSLFLCFKLVTPGTGPVLIPGASYEQSL